MIKGKSPDEIRKTFNIQNDFTPEEEDQIRRENEWAEEWVFLAREMMDALDWWISLVVDCCKHTHPYFSNGLR